MGTENNNPKHKIQNLHHIKLYCSKEMKTDKTIFRNRKTEKRRIKIITKITRIIDREWAQRINKISRIAIKIWTSNQHRNCRQIAELCIITGLSTIRWFSTTKNWINARIINQSLLWSQTIMGCRVAMIMETIVGLHWERAQGARERTKKIRKVRNSLGTRLQIL